MMEPLWLCRDNFIRTSVRNVACATDNAARRVAVGGFPSVDPVAAFLEEERDHQAHTRHFGLYRRSVSGAGLAQPVHGSQETWRGIGCDHLG